VAWHSCEQHITPLHKAVLGDQIELFAERPLDSSGNILPCRWLIHNCSTEGTDSSVVRPEVYALEDATTALFVSSSTPGLIRCHAPVLGLPPALQVGSFLAGLLIGAPFAVG
jgi:hypothetical protein